VNVGENTTLCDCDVSEEFVQFFVVPNGELKMTWDDTGFLVVSCCVSGQLEDFSCKIFKYGCEVDWCTSSDSLSVVALAEKTVNTSDWECETSLGRSRLGALSRRSFSARFSARHDFGMCVGWWVMGVVCG